MEARITQSTTPLHVSQSTRQKPRKLSKLGEWMRREDRDVWVINDMKAVLK